MSGVPAGRREAHDFLANHHLTELRKLITELAINDFGYDRTKDDMYLIHPDKDNIEETIRGIEKEATELGLFMHQ